MKRESIRKRLTKLEAGHLGLEPRECDKGRSTSRYTITPSQWREIEGLRGSVVDNGTETAPNDYSKREAPKFVLSAWNDFNGVMMDIDTYCEYYSLPREDISSYKLITHTGTPYYNIVFRENAVDGSAFSDIDIEAIVKKHIDPIKLDFTAVEYIEDGVDFDVLTYTDVHIGMEVNPDSNSMYPMVWNKEEIMKSAKDMVQTTLYLKDSNTLIVDDLGDFLDGFNAQTVRGGHGLPQNMTNEEAFDCAVEFKMYLADCLIGSYKNVVFNNICNDNHAGSFGYFVSKTVKEIISAKYKDRVEDGSVKVNNHRKFINHYFVGDVCFLISHGKDDKTLKYGFKPALESKGLEKIDQYCKQHKIYRDCDLVVFKKGDSHQALFDMCTSDDFYYYNYPALSPSSQWVQNNFKKGRRGFINESYIGTENTIKTTFLK